MASRVKTVCFQIIQNVLCVKYTLDALEISGTPNFENSCVNGQGHGAHKMKWADMNYAGQCCR